LIALSSLADTHGYALVAVSESGGNAFFVRRDQDGAATFAPLDPQTAYRENLLRNQWSGTTAAQQWETIKHMTYVQL
jgi:hypothetical protein